MLDVVEDSAHESWRPRRVRDTASVREHDALVEGIPGHLERSAWRWLMDRTAEGRMDLVYRTERTMRISLHAQDVEVAPQKMFNHHWNQGTDDDRLDLFDFLLHDMYERGNALTEEGLVDGGEDLALAMLATADLFTGAGSAWRVSEGDSPGSAGQRDHPGADRRRVISRHRFRLQDP